MGLGLRGQWLWASGNMFSVDMVVMIWLAALWVLHPLILLVSSGD